MVYKDQTVCNCFTLFKACLIWMYQSVLCDEPPKTQGYKNTQYNGDQSMRTLQNVNHLLQEDNIDDYSPIHNMRQKKSRMTCQKQKAEIF